MLLSWLVKPLFCIFKDITVPVTFIEMDMILIPIFIHIDISVYLIIFVCSLLCYLAGKLAQFLYQQLLVLSLIFLRSWMSSFYSSLDKLQSKPDLQWCIHSFHHGQSRLSCGCNTKWKQKTTKLLNLGLARISRIMLSQVQGKKGTKHRNTLWEMVTSHVTWKLVYTVQCIQWSPAQLGNMVSQVGKWRNNVSWTDIEYGKQKLFLNSLRNIFYSSRGKFYFWGSYVQTPDNWRNIWRNVENLKCIPKKKRIFHDSIIFSWCYPEPMRMILKFSQ